MPLYQKILDMSVNTSNNSNATMSRGAIYCPDQLSIPSVSTVWQNDNNIVNSEHKSKPLLIILKIQKKHLSYAFSEKSIDFPAITDAITQHRSSIL